MGKIIRWILGGVCAFFLFGCSINQEIPEEQVLYRMQWEGKEITFYESSILSYTDGDTTYASGFHMLNSEDGTKRLYVIEDAFGTEYEVIQEDVILEPVGMFVVKNYEGEMYEQSFEFAQSLGILDESLTLTNVVAKVYSLDVSKDAKLWFDGMPETISRRWEDAGDNMIRGLPVNFTLEELQQMISAWTKTTVAKNQISQYDRERQISWEAITSNELIYSNGLEMHVPEIVVSSVKVGENQYMEVENRTDYSNAFTSYYELTNQQWEDFISWKEELTILR